MKKSLVAQFSAILLMLAMFAATFAYESHDEQCVLETQHELLLEFLNMATDPRTRTDFDNVKTPFLSPKTGKGVFVYFDDFGQSDSRLLFSTFTVAHYSRSFGRVAAELLARKALSKIIKIRLRQKIHKTCVFS